MAHWKCVLVSNIIFVRPRDRTGFALGLDRNMSKHMDTSLIVGWLPVALSVAGLLALVGLAFLPARSSWWIRSASTLIGCAILVAAADLYVTKVWRPFPDTLPLEVLAWSWLAVAGTALSLAHLHWRRRAAALLTVPILLAGALALTGGAEQVNRYYGQYPTLGIALGVTTTPLTDLSTANRRERHFVRVPHADYLSDVWTPPPGLPPVGTVSKIHIPPTDSGFRARDGFLYLPPAYQANPRPKLPVLVLLAGQPGTPAAWLISGRVDIMMNGFARMHRGLAPVVLMVDDLGSTFANPLCINSRRGNAETYLAHDVPDWVRANLQTSMDRTRWAIGGLSEGGTCSLQLALRAPRVYGRFIDISGGREPIYGSRQITISRIFGGSKGAYAAVNPIDIMHRRTFPATAGCIIVGKNDPAYRSQQLEVLALGRAAGMDLTYIELPGGHTWHVWGPGLKQSLPWLAEMTRLVRPSVGQP